MRRGWPLRHRYTLGGMEFPRIQSRMDLPGQAPDSPRDTAGQMIEPKLKIDWGSFHGGVWTHLAALFGPSATEGWREVSPFRDSWVEGRAPRAAVVAAALWHIAVLVLPVSLLAGASHRNLALQNVEVSWQAPMYDLPPIKIESAKPTAARVKTESEKEMHYPTPVAPVEAFHPRQRIEIDIAAGEDDPDAFRAAIDFPFGNRRIGHRGGRFYDDLHRLPDRAHGGDDRVVAHGHHIVHVPLNERKVRFAQIGPQPIRDCVFRFLTHDPALPERLGGVVRARRLFALVRVDRSVSAHDKKKLVAVGMAVRLVARAWRQREFDAARDDQRAEALVEPARRQRGAHVLLRHDADSFASPPRMPFGSNITTRISSMPIQKYQNCGVLPENWSRATMKMIAPISPP